MRKCSSVPLERRNNQRRVLQLLVPLESPTTCMAGRGFGMQDLTRVKSAQLISKHQISRSWKPTGSTNSLGAHCVEETQIRDIDNDPCKQRCDRSNVDKPAKGDRRVAAQAQVYQRQEGNGGENGIVWRSKSVRLEEYLWSLALFGEPNKNS